MISVVSPVYMAQEIVDVLIDRLNAVLQSLGEYEIILIDDYSTDSSWEKIKDRTDIIALRNERNIGQHATIQRGVTLAKGDWIVVMDCDLQDNPDDIPALLAKAQEGFDIVYARRTERKDNWFRQLGSQLFHLIFSTLKGVKTDPAVANFAIYRRVFYGVRDCRIATVNVVHRERYAGKSSYSLWKLIKLTIKFLR